MQSQIQTNNKESGFTLIELSIVLVIIGLIVAGVLVGQDLIKAAQIRALVTQLQNYDAAVNTFHNKYGDMPGSIANATNYFPASDVATCSGSATPPTTGTGQLQNCVGTYVTLDGQPAAFWKQLADAQLIGDSITDVNLIAGTAPTSISNAFPAAKNGNGNFVMVYTGNSASGGLASTGSLSGLGGVNVYRIAGLSKFTSGAPTFSQDLTPLEALQIDTKKDDGLPATGVVRETDATAAADFNLAADVYTAGATGCVMGGTAPAPDFYNTTTGAASSSGAGGNNVENSRLCQLVIRGSL